MNALIFGANGQDGFYLELECKERGINVVPVSRTGNCIHTDVSSYQHVKELISQYNPAYIFHLAANSSTRHETLFENHATICTGTLNILEATKIHCPNAKVFITGSGVQFQNNGLPISENDPFAANSPYAIARIQSVYAARYYRSLGIKTYVGYLFHHESPHRKEKHVSKMIASAVRRIAEGSNEKIQVGDTSIEKEWTFAGDVVKGILTLIEQQDVYEAVIGSGIAYSIQRWLEKCFTLIGKDWRDHVIQMDGFVPEYYRLVSNPATIFQLNWLPKIGLDELAEQMIYLP